MSKNVVVAKILTSHGVKSFVKLESYFDKPKDIFKYSNDLYDKNGKKFVISFIGTVKPDVFITKVEDITSVEAAKSYRNTELYLNSNLLPKADDNEFYYNDLLNLKVKSLSGDNEGIITSVNDFGAGTVIEIKWNNENNEESLPFIEDYFKEVNIEKGYVIVERPQYI